jgi:hypothetical protein
MQKTEYRRQRSSRLKAERGHRKQNAEHRIQNAGDRIQGDREKTSKE